MKSQTPSPTRHSPGAKWPDLKLATYLHQLPKLDSSFTNTPLSPLCMVLKQENHFSVTFLKNSSTYNAETLSQHVQNIPTKQNQQQVTYAVLKNLFSTLTL